MLARDFDHDDSDLQIGRGVIMAEQHVSRLKWPALLLLVVFVGCRTEGGLDSGKQGISSVDGLSSAEDLVVGSQDINLDRGRLIGFRLRKYAGSHYTITLATLRGDLDLYGHWRPDFYPWSETLMSINPGREEDSIEFTARESADYYLVVHAYQGGTGRITVDVDADEGTPSGGLFRDSVWGGGSFDYYAGRSFFYDQNHLGADIHLTESTPVRAGVTGTIVEYRAAAGYGELVAVIEVDLGHALSFENAYGNSVSTSRVLWILGHLRSSRERGGEQLRWSVGDRVRPNDIIGYINDDAHNGDGAEHLHLGLRLQSARDAQATDPTAWFRGYEGTTNMGVYFGDPVAAINQY